MPFEAFLAFGWESKAWRSSGTHLTVASAGPGVG